MKSLAALATLTLLSTTPAQAQFVHGKPGDFFGGQFELRFTHSATGSVTTLFSSGNAVYYGAADNVGGRLYLTTQTMPQFLRTWNFGSTTMVAAPQLIIDGLGFGFSPWGMTFANGDVYFTSLHPTGFSTRPNRIYKTNPATGIGATWLGENVNYFNPKGIAFDAPANRFLVAHYQDAPIAGTYAPGIYAIDATTKAISFVTSLPPSVTYLGDFDVAVGHLWTPAVGDIAVGMDLSTLTWNSTSYQLTAPLSGPVVWAPGMLSDCAGVVYCTAGTSSNGCVPSICASGVASASSGSGFNLTISNVEGQRSGLMMYGISGPLAAPWSATSTSFRCVKTPNQRMGTQVSGGTDGACDGMFVEDWNVYVATHPGALGQPFGGGETVWATGWYRDPPAPKATNLAGGIEFVVAP